MVPFHRDYLRHLLCSHLFFRAARRVYIPPSRRSSALFYMRLLAGASVSCIRAERKSGRVLIVIVGISIIHRSQTRRVIIMSDAAPSSFAKGVVDVEEWERARNNNAKARMYVARGAMKRNEEFSLRGTIFRWCLLRYITIVYRPGCLIHVFGIWYWNERYFITSCMSHVHVA